MNARHHAVAFLILATVGFAPLGVRAGFLDDLKQIKDDAKDKAQQAVDDAKQKAEDAAQQAGQQNGDNGQPGGDQTAPADNGQAAAAPADHADATAGTDQAAPSADQAAPEPAQTKSLPAASALAVELRAGDPNGDNPPGPARDFPANLGALWVRVLEAKDTDFTCWVRLIAVDVRGLVPNQILASTPNAVAPAWSDDLGKEYCDAALSLPRMLLPGRYRVDLVEEEAPFRVAASFPLSMNPAPAAAGPFNLADPENGGLLEWATGEDGAGASWSPQLLRPGNDKVWAPPVPAGGDDSTPPPLPWELVISFFNRQPALVSSVEITADSPDDAPHDVEVWGSSDSATDGFKKLAAFSSAEPPATLVVAVPPTSVRFLKIRLLSKNGDDATLRLTGVRVLEGAAPGYTPLAQRLPDMAQWKAQPRHAAQAGLFYLQASALDFQREQNCIGCHVQSQALMGLTIAGQNDYIVSEAARRRLVDYVRRSQLDAGCFARSPERSANEAGDQSNTTLCALGLTYAHRTPDDLASLRSGALWLTGQQQDDGSVLPSDEREPVTQGRIFQTSNCLDVWTEALKQGDDPKLRTALARGLAFIAQADTATTQDEVFKTLALLRHGDDAQKQVAGRICAQLLEQQKLDGGWPVDPGDPNGLSRPFSTGEALYTLRAAGTSVRLPAFQRGVRWLIAEQRPDGAWESPPCATQFASTMWPVIALVGAFTTKAEPAHIVVTSLPRLAARPAAAAAAPPPPPPAAAVPDRIEFILDCSFSMYSRLGDSDRLSTAKQVMRGLIAKLPAGAVVGLRLYGHRYDSMSFQSRTDTQLVVPIQPLNRDALLKQIGGADAHGQTPLVYSTLQAADDLKRLGGGTIVLVTDGEESCGGRPREAGPKIAALGVPIRLFIIGFTLKGQRIANDMAAFAQPTGGRYFAAADGPQLAAALTSAVAAKAPVVAPPPPPEVEPPPAPPDLPFEILDSSGKQVAAGSTLRPKAADLSPGTYRVVLHDGARNAEFAGIELGESEVVELRYSPADGRLERVAAP